MDRMKEKLESMEVCFQNAKELFKKTGEFHMEYLVNSDHEDAWVFATFMSGLCPDYTKDMDTKIKVLDRAYSHARYVFIETKDLFKIEFDAYDKEHNWEFNVGEDDRIEEGSMGCSFDAKSLPKEVWRKGVDTE